MSVYTVSPERSFHTCLQHSSIWREDGAPGFRNTPLPLWKVQLLAGRKDMSESDFSKATIATYLFPTVLLTQSPLCLSGIHTFQSQELS